MTIHYLPADETLTGRNGVFPRWRASKAQPLMHVRRFDLRSQPEWRGCSANWIRDGLNMKHLEPRFDNRVRRLNLNALPTTKRRSYVQRMARYARHLAMAKALVTVKPLPVTADDELPFPFDYPLNSTGETTMTYKPNYDKGDFSRESDTPNLSGLSPRHNISIEERAQRATATNPQWMIARELLHDDRNSIEVLAELGFTDIKEASKLFFSVTPPEGWTKSTDGYWTTVLDADGNARISQFYKGAWYDERAFFSVKEPKAS